ncbi:MAG: hypothetical protein GY791_17080 [Alphaproteobacteria bacterium]|nr:hypothetical protein [Alphaproteobacteria bacterium]
MKAFKFIIFLSFLGCLAVAPSLVDTAAMAQTETEVKLTKREKIKNWTYLCFERAAKEGADPVRFCRINTQLWAQGEQQKRLIIAVIVRLAGEQKTPVMTLRMPPGLVVGEKVRMQVDEQPALLSPPVECRKVECRTEMSMSDQQIKQMQAGTQFKVTFAGPEKKAFRVDVSLLGFTRAIKTLRQAGI